MSGFITLQRQLLEWEWYKDINTKSLFIHCLLRANWECSNWKGVSIERGSFITSNDTLSKELNLSVKQIRTAISKLEKTNEIIKKGANKYTVLTVVKYDFYQNINNERANKGQTKGKQRATDNNNNNNNKLTTKETIKERKLKFAHTLTFYVDEFGKEMITDFYNYWSESNKTETKFKQELQKTWDVKMRLNKWKNNNFGNNKNNLKIIQDEQLTEIARLARSGQLG